jgi:hypothetical protein
MFGKLLAFILVTEVVGVGLLGAHMYSEYKYQQGKRDAYQDVNDKLGGLLKDIGEKHESKEDGEA